LKKHIEFIFLVVSLAFFITGWNTAVYAQSDSLSLGLQNMIQQLKTGQRAEAFGWFKSHYYELHKQQLLSDSILVRLSEKKPVVLNDDSNRVGLNTSLKKIIRSEVGRIAKELGEKRANQIPVNFISEIEKYIVQYRDNTKLHAFFNTALHRSRKYIPALKKYFVEKGFPEDVLYFALIESGFKPNALSSAGAAGMFQFMPGTAKEYGLNVNSDQDERFFIVKSAKAAADYLMDLYLELGSLNLALASYNSGPAKTRRALRTLNDVNDRSFWGIHQKSDVLKSETRNYVPQVYAAIIMAQPQNCARFGFDAVPFPPDSSYDILRLSSARDITHLLLTTDLSKKEVLDLNLDITRIEQIKSMDNQDYPLFVPSRLSAKLAAIIQSSAPMLAINPKHKKGPKEKKGKTKPVYKYVKEAVLKATIFKKGDSLQYRVQRGNTLHMVSRLFKVREEKIIKWNHLRFRSLRKGQVLSIHLPRSLKKIEYRLPNKVSYKQLSRQFLQPASDLRQLNRFKSAWLAKGDTVFVYLPLR